MWLTTSYLSGDRTLLRGRWISHGQRLNHSLNFLDGVYVLMCVVGRSREIIIPRFRCDTLNFESKAKIRFGFDLDFVGTRPQCLPTYLTQMIDGA